MTELEQDKLDVVEPPAAHSDCQDGAGGEEVLPKREQEEPPHSVTRDSNLNQRMEPSGNGVVVTVSRYPVDRPLSSASLEPSSDKNALPDPFYSESMEKGLSCLSLEVMTSGEHLNALSLEDLSSHGSGQDSAPECASSEGELEAGEPSPKGGELEPESGCGQESAGVEDEVGATEGGDECPKEVTPIVEGELDHLGFSVL